MKKYIGFTITTLALASCADNEFVGGEYERIDTQHPIAFGYDLTKITRAGGSDAATALGNQFIVWGEKNEAEDGSAATAGNLVFPNYQVNYTDATANTTNSNTRGWEYVGYTHTDNYQANITYGTTAASSEAQTIKYWDYQATNYVYTAVSANQADIEAGKVKIKKINAATTGNKVYDKGYAITLAEGADLSKVYVSDRLVISHTAGTDHNAENAYGGVAKFTFYGLTSRLRVAFYETIPGYSVKVDKFYYADAAAPTFDAMATENATNFVANVPNATAATGTVNVVYNTSNKPVISLSGSSATNANYLTLGANIQTATALATNSTDPTFDTDTKAFTTVFPQEDNDKSMKIKLDYTLTAPVTGEVITVVGATAEIPAQYLKWKPNFAYTYLFKISDNTNGTTGGTGDPAGLYPVTFDAVQAAGDNGSADWITTVSEPSISTMAVKDKVFQTATSDYVAGSDVYAVFTEGGAVKTPTLGGSTGNVVNVYKVTTADAAKYPITEASVAESVANSTNNKITCTNINADASANFTAAPAVVTEVPSETGSGTITLDALKLTGVKTGTYAIEYKASAAWTGSYDKIYTIIVVK